MSLLQLSHCSCICVVYVDMGLSSSSPVVLTVVTAGNSFARSFSIKVTQIECNSLAKGTQNVILLFVLWVQLFF